jgi:hypothetical protein
MLERPDLIVPLVIFSFVAFVTPGPNNLMLMTSGLNFGLRRTLPHLLGIEFGFAFMFLCVGLGLGAFFKSFPILYTIIKYAGAGYMLFLAWKIETSEPPDANTSETTKQPLSFMQAAVFQWVNPKAIAMAIGTAASYSAVAAYPYNMVLIAVLFILIGIPSCTIWAGLGVVMQRFLHRPTLLRGFNIVMAMLLAASLYPVFADIWR